MDSEEAVVHPQCAKLPQRMSQAYEGSREEHTSLHTAQGQAVTLTVFPSHLESAIVHLRDFPYA